MIDPMLGALWYIAFLFSLTCHEAAHAWIAYRGGDSTAYIAGQVTLDPRPHMRREPFGTIAIPLAFFLTQGWMIGWASTPYDLRWARLYPRRAAWMSLAGPLANVALFVCAAGAMHLGVGAGVYVLPESAYFSGVVVGTSAGAAAATSAQFLSILFSLNLLLAIFNLVPLPPLDGSGAIALLLPESLGRRLQMLWMRPGISLLGLIVAWLLLGRVFGEIFPLAIGLLYGTFPAAVSG